MNKTINEVRGCFTDLLNALNDGTTNANNDLTDEGCGWLEGWETRIEKLVGEFDAELIANVRASMPEEDYYDA